MTIELILTCLVPHIFEKSGENWLQTQYIRPYKKKCLVFQAYFYNYHSERAELTGSYDKIFGWGSGLKYYFVWYNRDIYLVRKAIVCNEFVKVPT